MASKFDKLRAGEVVEIEPGRKGRLNLENKTFVRSDGRQTYVGDDPDFFPPDEEGLKFSREKESLERDVKKAPFGEFLYQFGNKGVAGSVKNTYNKLTKSGDDYLRSLKVNQSVGERISEESPWTSGAASVASFIPDIALTKGMGGARAGATLAGVHAGTRIVEEPEQVAGEIALGGAGGFLIQKGADAVNKIAQRRGAVRALPGQQQAVRDQNIAGQQTTNQTNIQQNNAFNVLKQNVKSVNDAKLQQHKLDLHARENQMIQAKNAYEQAKVARDNQVITLKNQAEIAKAQRSADASKLESEYRAAKASAEQENRRLNDEFKLSQNQYQEALKKMPELQGMAQAEYSQNVVRKASEIEKMFPKNSRIDADELGLSNFIEDSINQTGLAGSREASQARRVLQSIFPEGELISGRELSKKYRTLEESIQRAAPEVQNVLNNFKNHMGERLPFILENSIAYHKISPLLQRTIRADVKSILNDLGLSEKVKNSISNVLETNAFNSVKNDLRPQNFIEKIQNGELAREIANSVGTSENFLVDLSPHNIKFMQKQGTLPILMKEAERQHAFVVDELTKKIQSRLARYELKATESARNASKKLGNDVKSTFGLAEPIPPPTMPNPPQSVPFPDVPPELPPVPPINLPPRVNPPVAPPEPPPPSLLGNPSPPTPQTFIPQPEPVLGAPTGLAERAGDFLEKPILGGGRSLVNNPLTKLAGLKYLLGPAALPAEAAYLGMKGLTSPTALGEAARMTFKQGGIQAVIQWAEKYPSFHEGIIENPQERRAFTKEIEDNAEIPIEQKAIIQSKINRGKPLQSRL